MRSDRKRSKRSSGSRGNSGGTTTGSARGSRKRRKENPRTRKAPLRTAIPPILLERDTPVAPLASGPGERYVLGPAPPASRFEKLEALGALPESYGTGKLILIARDPHWLYVAWDLSHEQQRRYNRLSTDGHLIVRTHVNVPGEGAASELHVHPESRNWFIHVARANTKYIAELGYRTHDGGWHAIATSAASVTPPETLSEDTTVQFATLPPEITLEEVLGVVESAVVHSVPLAEAVQQLRAEGHIELPVVSVPVPQAVAPEPLAHPLSPPGFEAAAAAAPSFTPATEPAAATPLGVSPALAFPSPSEPAAIPSVRVETFATRPEPAPPEQTLTPSVPSLPIRPDAPAQVWTSAPDSTPGIPEASPPPQSIPRPAPARSAASETRISSWTPAQEHALAEVLRLDEHRRVWMGSIEITELVRRQLQQAVTSPGLLEVSAPGPGGLLAERGEHKPSGISSPSGMPEEARGFWFNLNAEIVIYGATEPDAEVRITGRQIRLRSDGTFSCRFALPDGEYQLPVTATSADGTDGRMAALQFRRSTQYRGHVEAHPRDPDLKPPVAANIV